MAPFVLLVRREAQRETYNMAIQEPLSFRMGPSGRSLSLNMKWLLFQLPQLSQRSVKSWVRWLQTAHS